MSFYIINSIAHTLIHALSIRGLNHMMHSPIQSPAPHYIRLFSAFHRIPTHSVSSHYITVYPMPVQFGHFNTHRRILFHDMQWHAVSCHPLNFIACHSISVQYHSFHTSECILTPSHVDAFRYQVMYDHARGIAASHFHHAIKSLTSHASLIRYIKNFMVCACLVACFNYLFASATSPGQQHITHECVGSLQSI